MMIFLIIEGNRETKMSKPIWRFLDIPTLAPRKPIQIMAYFGICSDQGRGANKTYLQKTAQLTITAIITKRTQAIVNVTLSIKSLNFSIGDLMSFEAEVKIYTGVRFEKTELF